MELKLTKQRVLDAAESCETAREVLQILFPDVFTRTTVKSGDVVKIVTKWGHTIEALVVVLKGEKENKLTFVATKNGVQVTKIFHEPSDCLDIATVLKAEPEIAIIKF